MTYKTCFLIAEQMGLTETKSWREHNSYSTNAPSERLLKLLERHLMDSNEKWCELIRASQVDKLSKLNSEKNMLVRLYWSQCTLNNFQRRAEPIDAFWVEATHEEAEKLIFPVLSSEIIEKSKAYAENGKGIAAKLDFPLRQYCFLVAKDLSTIEPFFVHYPFSGMWNAYSPFEKLVESHIDGLEKLKTFVPCYED